MKNPDKSLFKSGPPRIRDGDRPGELIIDHDSTSEMFFALSALGFGLLAMGTGLQWLEDSLPGAVSVGFALASITSGYVYQRVDDFYVVDMNLRYLYCQQRFLGVMSRKRVAGLDELGSVFVAPRRDFTDEGNQWSYGVSFLTKKGKVLQILRPERTDYFVIEHLAHSISQRLDLRLVRGQPKQLMTVEAGPDGFELTFHDVPPEREISLGQALLWIVVGLFTIFVLTGLAIWYFEI